MTLYRAELETRNFSFEAYGPTEAKARDYLVQGLHRHFLTYSGRWNSAKQAGTRLAEFLDDITVREIKSGAVYRDREEI